MAPCRQRSAISQHEVKQFENTHRLEARLDLADQPGEGLLGEAVLGQHALGGQRRAQVRVKQEGGVAPRLHAQWVITLQAARR